ncbi:MAG: hypothetical protein MUF03_06300 [Rubrivivax sp.]|nr:hypothetical protein [Rubrivivax sp.]
MSDLIASCRVSMAARAEADHSNLRQTVRLRAAIRRSVVRGQALDTRMPVTTIASFEDRARIVRTRHDLSRRLPVGYIGRSRAAP